MLVFYSPSGIQSLIKNFPEFYEIYAEKEFSFSGINQPNRNPLLKLGLGADGLKTGWTQKAGYGIVGSALQDGRRVVFVLTGIKSPKTRAREAEQINNWVFRQFTERNLLTAGDIIHMAPVHLGEKNLVRITLKFSSRKPTAKKNVITIIDMAQPVFVHNK